MEIQKRAEAIGKFVGIPIENFEQAGREQLIYLLKANLNPSHKVVDIGCGVLRAAIFLIPYLNRGCYCGIEPHKERLEIGIRSILDPTLFQEKQPRFDTNANFDISVFDEKFDFFLAYSIWTHASKRQIQCMLDAFLQNTQETAVFLTTYYPSTWRHSDYKGDHWVGTSHESNIPGCINHSFRWIRSECERRGLSVLKLSQDKTHGQYWLEIKRNLKTA